MNRRKQPCKHKLTKFFCVKDSRHERSYMSLYLIEINNFLCTVLHTFLCKMKFNTKHLRVYSRLLCTTSKISPNSPFKYISRKIFSLLQNSKVAYNNFIACLRYTQHCKLLRSGCNYRLYTVKRMNFDPQLAALGTTCRIFRQYNFLQCTVQPAWWQILLMVIV